MTYDERNARTVATLQPAAHIAALFALWRLERIGEDILVVEGARNAQKQAEYVRKGTSMVQYPYSWHNHGCAIDIVPVKFGIASKLLWGSTRRYQKVAAIMKECGFTWGFDVWEFDKPHFHYADEYTIHDMAEHLESTGNVKQLSTDEIRHHALFWIILDIERMKNAQKFGRKTETMIMKATEIIRTINRL